MAHPSQQNVPQDNSPYLLADGSPAAPVIGLPPSLPRVDGVAAARAAGGAAAVAEANVNANKTTKAHPDANEMLMAGLMPMSPPLPMLPLKLLRRL